MSNFKKYYKTIQETTPSRLKRAGLLFESALGAAIPLLEAFLAAKILNACVDSAGAGKVTSDVFVFAGLLVLVDIVRRSYSLFFDVFKKQIEDEAEINIGLAISNKASRVSYSRFEDPEFLKLSERAEQFKYNASYLTTRILNSILQPIFSFLVALIAFFAISKLAAFIIILLSIPFFMFRIKLSRKERKQWEDKWSERRKVSGYIELSSPRSVKESRVLGLLEFSRKRWQELSLKLNQEERKVKNATSKLDAAEGVLNTVLEYTLIIIVVFRIVQGHLEVGYFVFAQTLIQRFLGSIYSLSYGISAVDQDVNLLVDYCKFIDVPEEPQSSLNQQSSLLLSPKVEVSNLSFKYPKSKSPALSDISLTIPFGKDVAIVGENGAGKTTLVKLILGLYKPTEGEVRINGNLVQEYDSEQWHKKIGVLFQDFNGFNDFNIEDAVWFGDVSKPRSKKEIEKALEKAGALSFVNKLEAKSKTFMNKWVEGGDVGTELSGGQYQRIALARIFFRDPDILILDEPTSAIDAKGEYEIFKILEEERKDKTNIFISHRFNTVRKADIIYFVEDGRIIESGSHAELIKLKGKYHDLFEKYAKDYR